MERVHISRNWQKKSLPKRFFSVALIYLPLFLLPFALVSALITYAHLRLIGAENLKTLKDFMPRRHTCRYNYESQILPAAGRKYWFSAVTRTKLYWIFNCTAYCPFSVALFGWHAYLVKVVENFWCPFNHEKKCQYAEGAIDKSYWHLAPENAALMHPEDRDNPMWNLADVDSGREQA